MPLRPRTSRRPASLAIALAIAACAAFATQAQAAIEVPFATRFAENERGDVAFAANTLMSCPESGPSGAECLIARAGGGGASLNNNGYAMVPVDADGDATTFDSSSAALNLPAGATVRFAGLYYGARTSAGAEGSAAPTAAARGTVLLRPPGAPGYLSLSAAVSNSASIAGSYTGFVDVTNLVAAAGPGDYAVANVQAGTGVDRYAGWALVVAYADPASAPHSIRIYDGLASIESADPPLQIGISGLDTPPSGTVNARVGVVAYEGDRGSSGDRLSLGGTPVFDAANPVNNVFNSSIAVNGSNVTTKTPNYVNQLGFDANLLSADGALANGTTATMLQESTTLEQYLTQVVTVSVELDPAALEPPAEGEEPKPHSKASAHVALEVGSPGPGPVRPGEVLELAPTVRTTGATPARNMRVCVRAPKGLRLLRAPRAKVRAGVACWHLAKLPRGTTRRYHATLQVEAQRRGTLVATTTVVSANAGRHVERTRLRVLPLSASACGSSARAAAPPALPRC